MTERVTKVRAEILILGVFQDARPPQGLAGEVDWIHHGILSRLILDEKFAGKIGDALLLHTRHKLPTPTTLILGLGDREGFDDTTLQRIFGIALDKIQHLQVKQCAMELFGLTDCRLDPQKFVESLMEAMKPVPVVKGLDLSLLVGDESKARQIEQRLSIVRGSV
jgi:hypothetical protein